MNIENISILVNQLQSLGFGDLGYSLLKRTAFKPESFVIGKMVTKGDDSVAVEMFFEKKMGTDEYGLKYYDVSLQQRGYGIVENIKGISISSLEKQMAAIDWKNAFKPDEQKPWNDKTDFSNEQAVESAMNDLLELESTDEGKAIASMLKLKYWAGANYFELFGAITPPKIKGEISQRFFMFEGQPGISLDEAYRFLQNRRMEKEMKRKQTDDSAKENDTNGEADNSGSGLLKKRRINGNTKKGKHKAAVQ